MTLTNSETNPANLWTDDRVDMLRHLWDEGHSARQIAIRIGSGISRNAVIGKAHRLGLSHKQVRAFQRITAIDVMEGVSSCQWPLGDPDVEGFHYCGEKAIAGKPYCRHHCGIAYLNMPSSDGAE